MNMKRNNKIKLCAIFLFVMCICDLLAQESFGECFLKTFQKSPSVPSLVVPIWTVCGNIYTPLNYK